ncbi:hypothetical protein H2200_003276 [Cladophialophora chaetospira]|uniref:Uncharacterized protein n=1 Tax=Cladophialophora chaetospira TaxID=386627 RepID=A0AA38XH48_9EURO|nr:hypothetical protein H2200_003276 [Cladophialophora chaetospira]
MRAPNPCKEDSVKLFEHELLRSGAKHRPQLDLTRIPLHWRPFVEAVVSNLLAQAVFGAILKLVAHRMTVIWPAKLVGMSREAKVPVRESGVDLNVAPCRVIALTVPSTMCLARVTILISTTSAVPAVMLLACVTIPTATAIHLFCRITRDTPISGIGGHTYRGGLTKTGTGHRHQVLLGMGLRSAMSLFLALRHIDADEEIDVPGQAQETMANGIEEVRDLGDIRPTPGRRDHDLTLELSGIKKAPLFRLLIVGQDEAHDIPDTKFSRQSSRSPPTGGGEPGGDDVATMLDPDSSGPSSDTGAAHPTPIRITLEDGRTLTPDEYRAVLKKRAGKKRASTPSSTARRRSIPSTDTPMAQKTDYAAKAAVSAMDLLRQRGDMGGLDSRAITLRSRVHRSVLEAQATAKSVRDWRKEIQSRIPTSKPLSAKAAEEQKTTPSLHANAPEAPLFKRIVGEKRTPERLMPKLTPPKSVLARPVPSHAPSHSPTNSDIMPESGTNTKPPSPNTPTPTSPAQSQSGRSMSISPPSALSIRRALGRTSSAGEGRRPFPTVVQVENTADNHATGTGNGDESDEVEPGWSFANLKP